MPLAVSLTSEQFRFGFGNELAEEESNEVFEQWAIPPGPSISERLTIPHSG
jgi:non-heme chloroperoxidase